MIIRFTFNFLFLDMILIFYRIAPNRLNFADKCHGYKAKSCVSVVRCASVAGQVQPHSVGGPLTLCCRACFLLFAPRDPRIGTDLCAHYKQLHGQASWELATGNWQPASVPLALLRKLTDTATSPATYTLPYPFR